MMFNNFIKFFLVSLIGLIIDVALFLYLLRNFNDAFLTNIVSSIVAVSFVFVAYRYLKIGKVYSFLQHFFWLIYQLVTILCFSYIIHLMIVINTPPLFAKLIILPITFSLNYLVLNRIINYSSLD